MKRLVWIALLALPLFVCGCFSYTTLHTATPVEKGKGQVNLSPGVFGIGDSGGTANVPTTEFAGRYGLGNNMDVGVKLYFLGTAFDFNWAVVNNSTVAFSLNPYISLSSFSATDNNGNSASITYGTALLNLLFDIKPADILTITIGAKPGWLYALGSANGQTDLGTGFAAGGMLGVKIEVSDNFAMMPSFDMLVPVMENDSGYLYSGGVGFQFEF